MTKFAVKVAVMAFALVGSAGTASATVFTVDAAVKNLAGFGSWISMTEGGFVMSLMKETPGGPFEPYSDVGGGGTLGCGSGPPGTTGCIENDDFSQWAGIRYTAAGSGPWRPDTIVIKKSDNSGFTFGGFEGGESLFVNAFGDGYSADAIRVTGIRSDTTTFVQMFGLDGLRDSAASVSNNGVDDLQTFASTSFFDVFVELQFTGINNLGGFGNGRDFTIDNILLDQSNAPAVPEPASLLMLGSGLVLVARRIRGTRAV